MINLYDIAYALGLAAAAPFWLVVPSARRKVLTAFAQRMGHIPPRAGARPAVMIHAVSLGEINAARGLIHRLRQLRPDLHLIISTTTATGHARAQELYASAPASPEINDVPFTIIRYPLDFTSAVTRALDALKPDLVVLLELEVWPNFIRQCARRRIPVMLINGRMTLPSYRKYRLALPVMARMFQRLSAVCVQDPVYARRFRDLGALADRLHITGNMKFDTADVASRIPGDGPLAAELHLHPAVFAGGNDAAPGQTGDSGGNGDDPPSERIWVCGSTGLGEEALILEEYRRLLARHARLRLILVPRKDDRFEEVARLITASGFALIRRSQTLPGSPGGPLMGSLTGSPGPGAQAPPPARTLLPPVILGDTMGELRRIYSLADVVFVGRTLVDLGPRQHGSDMIEPAALGKPVIVGPHTGNFADAMQRLRGAGGILEASSATELGQAVSILLSSPDQAREMGQRAQQVIAAEKGATERHARLILDQLASVENSRVRRTAGKD